MMMMMMREGYGWSPEKNGEGHPRGLTAVVEPRFTQKNASEEPSHNPPPIKLHPQEKRERETRWQEREGWMEHCQGDGGGRSQGRRTNHRPAFYLHPHLALPLSTLCQRVCVHL